MRRIVYNIKGKSYVILKKVEYIGYEIGEILVRLDWNHWNKSEVLKILREELREYKINMMVDLERSEYYKETDSYGTKWSLQYEIESLRLGNSKVYKNEESKLISENCKDEYRKIKESKYESTIVIGGDIKKYRKGILVDVDILKEKKILKDVLENIKKESNTRDYKLSELIYNSIDKILNISKEGNMTDAILKLNKILIVWSMDIGKRQVMGAFKRELEEYMINKLISKI